MADVDEREREIYGEIRINQNTYKESHCSAPFQFGNRNNYEDIKFPLSKLIIFIKEHLRNLTNQSDHAIQDKHTDLNGNKRIYLGIGHDVDVEYKLCSEGEPIFVLFFKIPKIVENCICRFHCSEKVSPET